MGRASRWLRGLLGGNRAAPPPALPAADDSHPLPSSKEKQQRWGSVKSFREKEPPPRSYRAPALRFEAVDDKEQSKRAISVAAAASAAAEAAVAAAHAAAAVVRLTSGGVGRRRKEWAAVKIQSLFRGYLARRALRALKGLVKLQALVRGNIVRKQAAATLRCMQALIRVQARAGSCRAIRSASSSSSRPHQQKPDPPIRHVSKSLKRSPSNRATNTAHSSRDAVDSDRAQSSGWNWVDRWMEDRYWDTRESTRKASIEDERNAKILEIDTGGNKHLQSSSSSTLTSDQNSLSSVEMRRPMTTGEFADSPQFLSATSSRPARGAFTPAKSECSRSVFSGYSDYPNYMSNTQSSKARVRSLSAPKQRPEMEKTGAAKRQPSTSPAATAALRAKFANKAYPGSGRLDRLGMPLAH